MDSFMQLSAGFLQASQETTLAIANANFDFALVKVEAPPEFQGVGGNLSELRKKHAEDGSIHVTARKLDKLFAEALPDCPGLIKAYGLRVSEISARPDINPRGHATDGVFGECTGADAMGIWAAATSGDHAIQVLLLACLLARAFRREVAVTIWDELVQGRKAYLEQHAMVSGQGDLAEFPASWFEISRGQLDEWDASARAWLRAADEAKQKQQIQLKLIIENLSVHIPKKKLYDSTMDVWITAMNSLECLIQGKPQRLDHGAVLLGLNSWHLYPDIVLPKSNQYIKQGDPLIEAGGVITLGLERKEDGGRGVSWSLPLSHIHHYGNPVVETQCTSIETSVVTFDEFLLVVIGCATRDWHPAGAVFQFEDDARLIKLLARILKSYLRIVGRSLTRWPLSRAKADNIQWLTMLSSAADIFIKSEGVERKWLRHLISLGRRRARLLQSSNQRVDPAFGLTWFPNLLQGLCNSHGEADVSARIRLLRTWAVEIGKLDPALYEKAVIRYWSDQERSLQCTQVTTEDQDSSWPAIRDPAPLHDAYLDEHHGQGHPSEEPIALLPLRPAAQPQLCRFLCGDSRIAAIYIAVDELVVDDLVVDDLDIEEPVGNRLTVAELLQCLESANITDINIIMTQDHRRGAHYGREVFKSLWATHKACGIFKSLSGAKVDLQVMDMTISKAEWLGEPPKNELQATFSCIAYFETGVLNLRSEDIGEDTFAMCYTNSIYVQKSLLVDPTTTESTKSVARIIGNVGRPGLVFLTNPRAPKTRKVDFSSWRMINHHPFDGLPQDSFGGTSFHLSFTGFEHPLSIKLRSSRDTSVYSAEAVVAIHDNEGTWVGDLDIWTHERLLSLEVTGCSHSEGEKRQRPEHVHLASVENWAELLDPPTSHAVIRAHGNSAARLALASISSRKWRNVIVLPSDTCWRCRWAKLPALKASPVRREEEAPRESESGDRWSSPEEDEPEDELLDQDSSRRFEIDQQLDPDIPDSVMCLID